MISCLREACLREACLREACVECVRFIKGESVAKAQKKSSLDNNAYLRQRFAAVDFRQNLTQALMDLLAEVAQKKVCEVIDRDEVRELMAQFDPTIFSGSHLAGLVAKEIAVLESALKKYHQPLAQVFDRNIMAALEAFLGEDYKFSKQTDALIARIMRQNLIKGLFVEVAHLALVSFYKKINPLFGGLTMKVLEKQIKGFLGLFIGIVVDHATAFVIKRENQALVSEFIRALVLLLLAEPLDDLTHMISPAQDKKLIALVTEAMTNASVERIVRQVTLKLYDDFYDLMGQQPVGNFIAVQKCLPLVERYAGFIAQGLSSAPMLEFIGKEVILVNA